MREASCSAHAEFLRRQVKITVMIRFPTQHFGGGYRNGFVKTLMRGHGK